MVNWYEFHDPSSLMSPSPGLTFKVFVVSYVVSTEATIITQVPSLYDSFSLRLSHFLIFLKTLRSRPQCSSNSSQMVTGFERIVQLIRVAHRPKS